MLQLFFISILSTWFAPDCYTVVERVEGESQELAGGTYIEIGAELVIFDGISYELELAERTYFFSREELRNLLECQYQFLEFSFADSGYLLELTGISAGSQVSKMLVYNQTTGLTSILQDQSRWQLERCAASVYTKPGILPATFVDEEKQVPYSEESFSISYQQPVFEDRTELVLKKEAFAVGEVVPAELQEVTSLRLEQESNVCKDIPTDYEIVTEQFLLFDAYTELEIVPATFETVSEQVLVKEATIDLDIQLAKDSTFELSIKLKDGYTEIQKHWKEGCTGFGIDCIEYELVTVPQRDSVIMATIYSCPNGYSRRHDLCLRSVEVPATFTTRTFEKLVTPLTSIATEIPAQYGLDSFIRIRNKSEIPDSCIEAFYKEATFTKLVTPASIMAVEVSSEIETRSFERLLHPGVVRVDALGADSIAKYKAQSLLNNASVKEVPTINDVFITDQLQDLLVEALTSRGYNKPSIYENYFDYLCDKGWPIGGITDYALADLEINIGHLKPDTIVSSTPKLAYDVLLSKHGSTPGRIQQLVATKDCQSTYQLSASVQVQAITLDETYFLQRDGLSTSKFRSELDGSLVYFYELGGEEEHVLVDYRIDNCEERFPVTHLGGDTIWLDVQRVFQDEQSRKIIEFDITISQCISEDPIYFQFIEGVGTNAGLNYAIEDGQVTSLLLCHSADELEVYHQPGYDEGCGQISTHNIELQQSVELWPNPAGNSFQVKQGCKVIKMMDQAGKSIKLQSKGIYYDISMLPSGIYHLLMVDQYGKHSTHRLAVHR